MNRYKDIERCVTTATTTATYHFSCEIFSIYYNVFRFQIKNHNFLPTQQSSNIHSICNCWFLLFRSYSYSMRRVLYSFSISYHILWLMVLLNSFWFSRFHCIVVFAICEYEFFARFLLYCSMCMNAHTILLHSKY